MHSGRFTAVAPVHSGSQRHRHVDSIGCRVFTRLGLRVCYYYYSIENVDNRKFTDCIRSSNRINATHKEDEPPHHSSPFPLFHLIYIFNFKTKENGGRWVEYTALK